MQITRREFSKLLAEKYGCTIKDAFELTTCFTDLVNDVTREGTKISFQGFGRFEVVERGEKRGVHPETHEPLIRPAHKTLAFRASRNQRELIDHKTEKIKKKMRGR